MYVQKDFGENKRDKDNQHRVELALLGFDCQVSNRPHFRVLPLHVGYLFETGYYKEPEASPSRDLPRIEYMKKSKYISEDERGGFKVGKVNLPPSDGRLRLFLEVKEEWLEEGLLVPAKKNKREGLYEKDLLWPKKEVRNKFMCHHLEEFRRHQVTTVVYQCKHEGVVQPCPTKFCGAQCSLYGAICTPSSTTTKCGHRWRIRYEEHANYYSHPNQCKPNG
jgi:hypothetical protein